MKIFCIFIWISRQISEIWEPWDVHTRVFPPSCLTLPSVPLPLSWGHITLPTHTPVTPHHFVPYHTTPQPSYLCKQVEISNPIGVLLHKYTHRDTQVTRQTPYLASYITPTLPCPYVTVKVNSHHWPTHSSYTGNSFLWINVINNLGRHQYIGQRDVLCITMLCQRRNHYAR